MNEKENKNEVTVNETMRTPYIMSGITFIFIILSFVYIINGNSKLTVYIQTINNDYYWESEEEFIKKFIYEYQNI